MDELPKEQEEEIKEILLPNIDEESEEVRIPIQQEKEEEKQG